ncbi:hypothetical protein [Escherichia phage vB_EcoS_PHB17]|uniref:Uncharacterized protein n=1 Tax=Escherichia phage vB_EcoS_PHB17 TaxID=2591407 RepID=A0A514DKQ5_9CAUD|nr:hypothetical protein KMB84_gp26 [Escherichia phage vB_EcoS_PHB17]QDH94229.1 hypothetical protein [Escherichia phage vB_EcoS_PHB17]
MKWKVKLTIRRMGRNCSSCRQEFECEVEAQNTVDAIQCAKVLSGADPETHQFSINFVRGI